MHILCFPCWVSVLLWAEILSYIVVSPFGIGALVSCPYHHCIWEIYEFSNFFLLILSSYRGSQLTLPCRKPQTWPLSSSETIDFEMLANGMNAFCLVRWMCIFDDQRWDVSDLIWIESSKIQVFVSQSCCIGMCYGYPGSKVYGSSLIHLGCILK